MRDVRLSVLGAEHPYMSISFKKLSVQSAMFLQLCAYLHHEWHFRGNISECCFQCDNFQIMLRQGQAGTSKPEVSISF